MTSKTKEREEFKDDRIKDFIKKGARSMPNPDFENKVMLKIQYEVAYKKEVASRLKISMQFFLGAVLAGIGISLFILTGGILKQFGTKIITVPILFLIGLVGIMSFDNYRRLIKKYSS